MRLSEHTLRVGPCPSIHDNWSYEQILKVGYSVGPIAAYSRRSCTVCEIREGQEGSDPSKSMRDPCKVVIFRDPGWVP